jgi:hypothetical protein
VLDFFKFLSHENLFANEDQVLLVALLSGLPGHHGEEFRELDPAATILIVLVDDGLKNKNMYENI